MDKLGHAAARAEINPSGKVFYPPAAHLILGDGTPLYLNWILEANDGKLYVVPAEPGGWLRRTQYTGERDRLGRVPRAKATAIVKVVTQPQYAIA